MRYHTLYERLFPLRGKVLSKALTGIVKGAQRRGKGTDWLLVANAQRFVETQSVANQARDDPEVRTTMWRATIVRRVRRSIAARSIQHAALRFLWHPSRRLALAAADEFQEMCSTHLAALPT